MYYSCNKFGHFAADCWSKKVSKVEEANITIGDFNYEPVIWMAYENVGGSMVD